MTVDEFMDLVPWGEMRVKGNRWIRHRQTDACPICAVWGGWNSHAGAIATTHGMVDDDAYRVTTTADGESLSRSYDRSLRAEMERRIAEAQHG